MADFLDTLTAQLERDRERLIAALSGGPPRAADALPAYVAGHWHPLPPAPGAADWPAFAVDGSVVQVDLDDGSYLVIARALCLGDGGEVRQRGGAELLPPSTPASTAGRYADLLQRHHEIALACEVVATAAAGSVVFLDGALYGWLPQLYALPADGAGAAIGAELPDAILAAYLELLDVAAARGVRIVAVAKTSREAAHCALWLAHDGRDDVTVPDALTDSALIHRHTEARAGVSTPVVLGARAFTGGSRAILDRPAVAISPAIVSCFVRLADLDDALRVDVPAGQCGLDARLADVAGEHGGAVVPDGRAAIAPTLALLQADYGGLTVYNALLYAVDREVRLNRAAVAEVYLPVIEQILGMPVRPDRSERRFAGGRAG